MSIDSARIRCTGCGYETREVYRPIRIRYLTNNGKSLATGRAKGWCYDCSSYSDIEYMNKDDLHDALAAKERERLDVRYRLDRLGYGFFSGLRQRSEKKRLQHEIDQLDGEIAELEGLLEIANSRKSNARCLKCWSDRTAPLTFDPRDHIAHNFQHTCGGNLQMLDDPSGPRWNFRLTTYILNEEGELLREE